MEIGRASDDEGKGESAGDEGEDNGGSKGEPGHEVCLSAERSMTGICVCCSLTLEDMAVDSDEDIYNYQFTYINSFDDHKNT